MRFVRLVALMAALGSMTAVIGGCQDQPTGSKSGSSTQARSAVPAAETQTKPTETSPQPSWPPLVNDGKESSLADDPLTKNYYVIFDSSASMSESKCSGGRSKSEVAKKALAYFSKTLPQDANLGLAVFDANGIAERLPLGRGNREAFVSAVQATVTGNGTPLHDAVALGYLKLTECARSQLGYGEYHMVIVTDGEANKGQDPTPVVNDILSNSPIVMHTIGFCIGTKHTLNQPGRTIYRAADNPEQLMKGLEDVLAESPSFDYTDFR